MGSAPPHVTAVLDSAAEGRKVKGQPNQHKSLLMLQALWGVQEAQVWTGKASDYQHRQFDAAAGAAAHKRQHLLPTSINELSRSAAASPLSVIHVLGFQRLLGDALCRRAEQEDGSSTGEEPTWHKQQQGQQGTTTPPSSRPRPGSLTRLLSQRLRHALELAPALLAHPGQLHFESLLLIVHLVQAARDAEWGAQWAAENKRVSRQKSLGASREAGRGPHRFLCCCPPWTPAGQARCSTRPRSLGRSHLCDRLDAIPAGHLVELELLDLVLGALPPLAHRGAKVALRAGAGGGQEGGRQGAGGGEVSQKQQGSEDEGTQR